MIVFQAMLQKKMHYPPKFLGVARCYQILLLQTQPSHISIGYQSVALRISVEFLQLLTWTLFPKLNAVLNY